VWAIAERLIGRLPTPTQRVALPLLRDFSVGAGELTATLKLRRKAVIEANREIVDAFYREG